MAATLSTPTAHSSPSVSLVGLGGIPEVLPGTDLAALMEGALKSGGISLRADDVLVVAQKIVSKAEGRLVALASVTAGAQAHGTGHRDRQGRTPHRAGPRRIHRGGARRRDVLIVRHRLGFVMANAGIDRSNVGDGPDGEQVLLLPKDPDASAASLRAALGAALGVAPGVLISDSFGRPWRKGVVNIALGAAGIPALLDRRGETDRAGRKLEVTEVALADALTAAAGLVMGEAAEGIPAVLIRGLHVHRCRERRRSRWCARSPRTCSVELTRGGALRWHRRGEACAWPVPGAAAGSADRDGQLRR